MLITRLARQLGGTLHLRRDDDITLLCHDSRSCTPGSAYFSFHGLHVDGDMFIADAISHGASLIVSDARHEDLEDLASFIVLEGGNIRRAYALASDALFDHPSGRTGVIGVTGTDGKTSTCHYIHQLLGMCGHRAGLLSTTSVDDGTGVVPSPYHNTTPEAYDVYRTMASSCGNGLEHFVLECSSHALSSTYDRLAGCGYAASCFTRITSEHLEFHRSRDEYFEAKLNLARHTHGPVFVYENSPVLERLQSIKRQDLVTLRCPQVVRRDIDGLVFMHEGKSHALPFFSDFALENAWMAACLVSRLLRIPLETVLQHLEKLDNPPGRQEIMTIDGRTVVIDFAHTPDAFDRLMTSIRLVHPSGSLIALFGASGDRDVGKRRGMGQAAMRHCQTIILTEDDPRSEDVYDICADIARGIDPGRCSLYTIPHREDAIRQAVRLSKPGDVVLLLGIGCQRTIDHLTYQIPWDEKAAVEKAFREVE